MAPTQLRSRLKQTLHRTSSSLVERARNLPVVARGELAAQQAFEEVERRFPRFEHLWLGLRAAAGAPGGPRVVERARAAQRVALAELSQSSDWRTRASAAVSLSMIGLRAQPVSARAIEGAPRLSSRAIEGALRRPDRRPSTVHGVELTHVVHGLAQALRDPSAEVAVCAADALGNLADAGAVAALRDVVENRDGYFSAVTRAAAVRALSRCLSDADLSFVFAAVRDLQPEVSLAAISTVLLRAREAALFHLLPVLRDTTGYFAPEVRDAALQGLRAAGVLSPSLEAELG